MSAHYTQIHVWCNAHFKPGESLQLKVREQITCDTSCLCWRFKKKTVENDVTLSQWHPWLSNVNLKLKSLNEKTINKEMEKGLSGTPLFSGTWRKVIPEPKAESKMKRKPFHGCVRTDLLGVVLFMLFIIVRKVPDAYKGNEPAFKFSRNTGCSRSGNINNVRTWNTILWRVGVVMLSKFSGNQC